MNYFGLFFSFLIPGMIIGALIAVGVCTDKFKKSETTSNFRTHNVCVPDDAKRGGASAGADIHFARTCCTKESDGESKRRSCR